jgi:hypothetical protein
MRITHAHLRELENGYIVFAKHPRQQRAQLRARPAAAGGD